VSPPQATPGRKRRATGRHPAYVIEIDISPQIRARDPGRPLSLSEALDTGPARRRDSAARGAESRPAQYPAAARASSQLHGTLQPAAAGRADNLRAAGAPERLAAGRDPAAVRSVGCPCTAPAGTPCGLSGDHLARYLRAEQRGAIARQTLTQVIEGLDIITPNVLIWLAADNAAPGASERAAKGAVCGQLDAATDPGPAGHPARTAPAAPSCEPPEPEAGA
jgi:hypothetical protein